MAPAGALSVIVPLASSRGAGLDDEDMHQRLGLIVAEYVLLEREARALRHRHDAAIDVDAGGRRLGQVQRRVIGPPANGASVAPIGAGKTKLPSAAVVVLLAPSVTVRPASGIIEK